MSMTNFSTANLTFRQIMANGLTYRVPRFQRDYSWTQTEWEDLWEDIQETVKSGNGPPHYMGYLVLQSQDNRRFDVIDGQQRLTTLSLLALAVLRSLQRLIDAGVEAEPNARRLDQLRGTYLGYLDPVTLVAEPKLTLNRNNNDFYQDRLLPLQSLPQRGLRASERLLRQSFSWFDEQVQATYLKSRQGADLARFIDSLTDKLLFTVITVTDELNAFRVFETLNARGVRLSPTDLLKNYLFSVVHREHTHAAEIEALERRWSQMVDELGDEDFPDFLRVHWNSRQALARESALFKTIRAATPDRAAVFALLRDMEADLSAYVGLAEPENSSWPEDQRRHVRELRMYSVRQPWPLLLAGHRTFKIDDFTRLLRACSIISFRYNVIGGRATNTQERVYNDVAQAIVRGQFRHAGDAIRALAPLYLTDNEFRSDFAVKELRTTVHRNARIVRDTLFAIEQRLSGRDYDANSSQYTIEHILPKNPDQGWSQFSDEQTEASIFRLGNYTLLEANLNRAIGNVGFADKRAIYAQSQFELTRRIAAENDDWTPERLNDRQRWLATEAAKIWRLDQVG